MAGGNNFWNSSSNFTYHSESTYLRSTEILIPGYQHWIYIKESLPEPIAYTSYVNLENNIFLLGEISLPCAED